MYDYEFVVLMFGIFFGIIIIFHINEWRNNRPIYAEAAPKFCEFCGCPIKIVWYNEESPRFDKDTGKGTVTKRGWFECSKSSYHYARKSHSIATSVILADCDPVQTLGSQS